MVKAVVAKNKVVSLSYVLRDRKGEIFEYSDLPVSYLHGSHTGLFEKIERSLEGHGVGDKVTAVLGPREAFGEHDPALTFTDTVDNVPPELRFLGKELEAQNAKGEVMRFVVTNIENDKLTVDANHPLAGQSVTFEVTVKDIRDATLEELANGRAASTFAPPT